jgi:hypothetical protein
LNIDPEQSAGIRERLTDKNPAVIGENIFGVQDWDTCKYGWGFLIGRLFHFDHLETQRSVHCFTLRQGDNNLVGNSHVIPFG